MTQFEKNLINKLLDKYENSKLSKGGTINNRKIKLTTKDDVLRSYNGYDSFKYANDNDLIIRKLEESGYIFAYFENDSFKSLELNIKKIDELYEYIGRDKPSEELSKVKEVLSNYKFNNFLDNFLVYIKTFIEEKYDYPKSYFNDAKQLQLLLETFKNMFLLNSEMKKRDFSVKYLGDSKLFESIQGKIIKIIRNFDNNEYDNDDDVLAEYNIIKNSSYALVKNNLILSINKSIINLNDLGFELSLSDEMIDSLIINDCNVTKVITVENLTTFYGLDDKDAVIIYLAGFHNHTKQKLLLKIYDKFPEANYYHFSDIDAGGFLIYNNLKNKTQIPFKPYRMDINELVNNKDSLKCLTENDRKRLEKMLTEKDFEVFYNTINYMLENNVKLEQEILD